MFSPILRLLAIYVAVAVALFAFFNRDRVTGMLGWNQPEPAPVSATPTTPAPVSEPTPAPEPQPKATAEEPPRATGSAPVFAPQPGENGVPQPEAVPEAGAQGQAPAPTATPETPVTPAPILQTPTPPAQPLVRPAGDLAAPTPPAPAAPASLEDGLADARAKYWQNDIPGAIAAYTALLEEYPGNETLHGELGNIYFLNGQRVEAATQYEAAAMAALKAGHRQQAQALLGILGSLDRAAAERVQAALEETP